MFKRKWRPQISTDKEQIEETAFFCVQTRGGLRRFNVATHMGGEPVDSPPEGQTRLGRVCLGACLAALGRLKDGGTW